MTMTIESVSIAKDKYGPDKDQYVASICVAGDQYWQPSITMKLTPEQLSPIVEIIQAAVAEAMASAAKAFAEDVQASITGPIIDQKSIETEKTA